MSAFANCGSAVADVRGSYGANTGRLSKTGSKRPVGGVRARCSDSVAMCGDRRLNGQAVIGNDAIDQAMSFISAALGDSSLGAVLEPAGERMDAASAPAARIERARLMLSV